MPEAVCQFRHSFRGKEVGQSVVVIGRAMLFAFQPIDRHTAQYLRGASLLPVVAPASANRAFAVSNVACCPGHLAVVVGRNRLIVLDASPSHILGADLEGDFDIDFDPSAFDPAPFLSSPKNSVVRGTFVSCVHSSNILNVSFHHAGEWRSASTGSCSRSGVTGGESNVDSSFREDVIGVLTASEDGTLLAWCWDAAEWQWRSISPLSGLHLEGAESSGGVQDLVYMPLSGTDGVVAWCSLVPLWPESKRMGWAVFVRRLRFSIPASTKSSTIDLPIGEVKWVCPPEQVVVFCAETGQRPTLSGSREGIWASTKHEVICRLFNGSFASSINPLRTSEVVRSFSWDACVAGTMPRSLEQTVGSTSARPMSSSMILSSCIHTTTGQYVVLDSEMRVSVFDTDGKLPDPTLPCCLRIFSVCTLQIPSRLPTIGNSAFASGACAIFAHGHFFGLCWSNRCYLFDLFSGVLFHEMMLPILISNFREGSGIWTTQAAGGSLGLWCASGLYSLICPRVVDQAYGVSRVRSLPVNGTSTTSTSVLSSYPTPSTRAQLHAAALCKQWGMPFWMAKYLIDAILLQRDDSGSSRWGQWATGAFSDLIEQLQSPALAVALLSSPMAQSEPHRSIVRSIESFIRAASRPHTSFKTEDGPRYAFQLHTRLNYALIPLLAAFVRPFSPPHVFPPADGGVLAALPTMDFQENSAQGVEEGLFDVSSLSLPELITAASIQPSRTLCAFEKAFSLEGFRSAMNGQVDTDLSSAFRSVASAPDPDSRVCEYPYFEVLCRLYYFVFPQSLAPLVRLLSMRGQNVVSGKRHRIPSVDGSPSSPVGMMRKRRSTDPMRWGTFGSTSSISQGADPVAVTATAMMSRSLYARAFFMLPQPVASKFPRPLSPLQNAQVCAYAQLLVASGNPAAAVRLLLSFSLLDIARDVLSNSLMQANCDSDPAEAATLLLLYCAGRSSVGAGLEDSVERNAPVFRDVLLKLLETEFRDNLSFFHLFEIIRWCIPGDGESSSGKRVASDVDLSMGDIAAILAQYGRSSGSNE